MAAWLYSLTLYTCGRVLRLHGAARIARPQKTSRIAVSGSIRQMLAVETYMVVPPLEQ